MAAGTPNYRVRKVSELFPAFYLSLARGAPVSCFPHFPGGGQDPMGSHPCIRSSQSCFSFPNGPKPQDSDFQGDVRKDWKRSGVWRGWDPVPFQSPGRRESPPPPGICAAQITDLPGRSMRRESRPINRRESSGSREGARSDLAKRRGVGSAQRGMQAQEGGGPSCNAGV